VALVWSATSATSLPMLLFGKLFTAACVKRSARSLHSETNRRSFPIVCEWLRA
jgi:hypothetical protein